MWHLRQAHVSNRAVSPHAWPRSPACIEPSSQEVPRAMYLIWRASRTHHHFSHGLARTLVASHARWWPRTHVGGLAKVASHARPCILSRSSHGLAPSTLRPYKRASYHHGSMACKVPRTTMVLQPLRCLSPPWSCGPQGASRHHGLVPRVPVWGLRPLEGACKEQ